MWKKIGSGAPTFFLNTGGAIPDCEFDSSGNITAVHNTGANGLLSTASKNSSGWFSTYYAFDFRGNTVNLLGSSGTVYANTTYKAYNSRNADYTYGPGFDGMGGQFGYYRDSDSLYLCGQRYYSPTEGRWLSRDPIGYSGGINLYSYAGNNPINNVDPSGLTGSGTIGRASPLQVLQSFGARIWNSIPSPESIWNAIPSPEGIGRGIARAWNNALHPAPVPPGTIMLNMLFVGPIPELGLLEGGVVPLAYGPSAGGALRQFGNRFGADLLSDFDNPNALPIKDLSTQVLDNAAKTGRPVLWDLTHMDNVTGVLDGSHLPNAVTSHELRHIFREWSRFEPIVSFYRNGQLVNPPWIK